MSNWHLRWPGHRNRGSEEKIRQLKSSPPIDYAAGFEAGMEHAELLRTASLDLLAIEYCAAKFSCHPTNPASSSEGNR